MHGVGSYFQNREIERGVNAVVRIIEPQTAGRGIPNNEPTTGATTPVESLQNT